MDPQAKVDVAARNVPRVHYGALPIPPAEQICLGGQVKFQRLQPFFPDSGEASEILYLVSSCLPEGWLPAYWKARREGRRVVWNHSAVSYPAVWPELRADEDNLLLEQGLHAADYVIYQSDFCRRAADRFLGPFCGPSEVLYNAVDTELFVPASRRPDQGGTILLGGTQYRLSSLEIALGALAALRRRVPHARLLVTGSMCWIPDPAAAMQSARARASALGVTDAVEFIGEYTQAQAPEIFGRADVLIHTRYDDLCPNVVIEAMACGLPVVHSRTGGTPELVGDTAGLGVDTGHSWDQECLADPERWAEALERVIADRGRFADAARQRAVDRFDLRPWISRHAEIFEQVTSSPAVRQERRIPVNERLRAPLQLLACQPSRVRQGEGFNTQPDGRSALAIAAANASHATLVLLDERLLDTSFSSPSVLSATVPADRVQVPGSHRVRLTELLRDSNELELTVESAAAAAEAATKTTRLPEVGIAGLVSVVIPCYNQGHFLAEAIGSVLAQRHARHEVVVVDDGSTDSTASVAARFDVKYVHQSNSGLSGARNRGLRECSGAAVVFLDADDRLLPGALEAGLTSLESHPDCAFVFGGYRHIAFDGSPFEGQTEPPDDPDLYLTLLHYNHIGCPGTVMYRRGVFELVGGFDATLETAEDYDLYLRIARAFPIHRHPRFVVEYRKYHSSMSGDPARMLRGVLRVLRSQRRHLGSHDTYLEAWAQGMKGNREYYLGLLRMQVRGFRSNDVPWRRRLRLGASLLLWDPRAWVKACAPGAYCAFFQGISAIRNEVLRLAARRSGSTGRIAATPNPIRVRTSEWNGPASTEIAWQSNGAAAVEVHVHRPDGPLFSTSTPDARMKTGDWVTDGSRFYLQDVTGTEAGGRGRTLAVVTVNVVPE